ncbi:hypothetical protein D3C76_1613280 [compost metagenome]
MSEDNNINIARLQHNNGFVFKSGDIEDFRLKIKEFANMSETEYQKIGDNAFEFVRNNYDYKDIADQYTDVLVNEVNR